MHRWGAEACSMVFVTTKQKGGRRLRPGGVHRWLDSKALLGSCMADYR